MNENTIDHTALLLALTSRAERIHRECWEAIERAEAINHEVEGMFARRSLRDLDRMGDVVQPGIMSAGGNRWPRSADEQRRALERSRNGVRPPVEAGREVVPGDDAEWAKHEEHCCPSRRPRAGAEVPFSGDYR